MSPEQRTSKAGNSGAVQGQPCCSLDEEIEDGIVSDHVHLLETLGHATRYEALRLVARSDDGLCVCQIESALDVGQSATSQALSRLASVGLLTRRKEGRWRYYSATEAAREIIDVLDAIEGRDHE